MRSPYWASRDERVTLYHGDSLEVLRDLDAASVDACVTDPPYELGFMGRAWDASGIAYRVDLWREVLRVLKPGAHLLAFGGTRTYHRMTCAIEDAGFEVRDCITWHYGSGFPKSLDVSKAIDKAAGVEREVIGKSARHGGGVVGNGTSYEISPVVPMLTAPATAAARQWAGWGTALKPATEPIVVARKPLVGTVAANVQAHGTGAINVDGCRVGTSENRARANSGGKGGGGVFGDSVKYDSESHAAGRWPPNLLLTHSADCGDACAEDCPVRVLDEQTDSGGASRFFPAFYYTAKAATAERERGLEHRKRRTVTDGRTKPNDTPRQRGTTQRANVHPTVKPIDLMRWLVRLVTPPGGIVLDPFAGSGTTLVAAQAEQMRAIGIELDAEHCSIARDRIAGDAPLFAGYEDPTP